MSFKRQDEAAVNGSKLPGPGHYGEPDYGRKGRGVSFKKGNRFQAKTFLLK